MSVSARVLNFVPNPEPNQTLVEGQNNRRCWFDLHWLVPIPNAIGCRHAWCLYECWCASSCHVVAMLHGPVMVDMVSQSHWDMLSPCACCGWCSITVVLGHVVAMCRWSVVCQQGCCCIVGSGRGEGQVGCGGGKECQGGGSCCC